MGEELPSMVNYLQWDTPSIKVEVYIDLIWRITKSIIGVQYLEHCVGFSALWGTAKLPATRCPTEDRRTLLHVQIPGRRVGANVWGWVAYLRKWGVTYPLLSHGGAAGSTECS